MLQVTAQLMLAPPPVQHIQPSLSLSLIQPCIIWYGATEYVARPHDMCLATVSSTERTAAQLKIEKGQDMPSVPSLPFALPTPSLHCLHDCRIEIELTVLNSSNEAVSGCIHISS